MKTIKNIIVAALLLAGAWLIGYIIGRNHLPDAVIMGQTDTLEVRDTITIEKPVPVDTSKKEVVYVPVHDTTRVHDTLYVGIYKESKTYRGEDYMAVVSGYQPSLDMIEVYPKTVVISKTETTTQKPSSWRYAVDIGLDYRATVGRQYFAPNIGAEFGYKRFSLGVEAGVAIEHIDTPILYMQFGAKYTLFGR